MAQRDAQPDEPQRLAAAREQMQASSFLGHTGIRVVSLGDRTATVELPVTESLLQGLGVLHGGMFGALVDTAIGAAVFGGLKGEGAAVTIEFKVNLYQPGRLGDVLTARAEVLHLGRATAAGTEKITNQNGQLVGHGTATFMRVKAASLVPVTVAGGITASGASER